MNIASPEWFKKRALETLKPIEKGLWDFSDSALLYMEDGMQSYEKLQKESNLYKSKITDYESLYISKIALNLVSCLPQKFNFIDLGPGTEHKEDYFLSEIKRQGKEIIYIPVDISKYALDQVSEHVKNLGFRVAPILTTFEELSQSPQYDINQTSFISFGLTFANFDLSKSIEFCKNLIGKNNFVFIDTQPRERIRDVKAVRRSYEMAHIRHMYDLRFETIGIDVAKDISSIETTNDFKVFYTLKNISPLAKSLGMEVGDKVFVFQSMRYDSALLKNELEKHFNYRCFDTGDEFLGILLSPKS